MAETSFFKAKSARRFVPALFLTLIIGMISIVGAAPGLAQSGAGTRSLTKTPTLTPIPSATPRSTASPVPASATKESEAATPAATDVSTDDVSADTAKLPSSASLLTLDELESHNGIPVGFTEAGDPFMGDPGAPVTIFEFSDYLCPFCGRHYNDTLPSLIDEYVLPDGCSI